MEGLRIGHFPGFSKYHEDLHEAASWTEAKSLITVEESDLSGKGLPRSCNSVSLKTGYLNAVQSHNFRYTSNV